MLPEPLIDQERIRQRVAELAADISRDYATVDNLVLVGVLKGAFIFLADLSRALTIPRSVDFLAISSYGKRGAAQSGIKLVMDLRESVAGKHVLVVEDIVDSGRTLEYILKMLATRRPASLKTCALVRKPDRAEVDVAVEYLGFDIPDRWVVGYGLDYRDTFRTLPYIGVVSVDR